MNVCTSGRKIPDLVETHFPCGHVLTIVGYTARRNLPVEACPRCDNARNFPTQLRRDA